MNELVKLLLVEDNPADVRLIQILLAEGDRTGRYELTSAGRLSSALEILALTTPLAILLDLTLPDSQGLSTVMALVARAPRVPIIVLTGLDDEALAVRALQEGAQDYLVKNQLESSLLTRTIRYGIERKRVDEEVRRLNAELEERVRVRTAQLEYANNELESFSYSVSHDLRAPLRGIDGFAQALREEYASLLEGKGEHYLERIVDNTRRMGQLIDDLLNLSRVSRLDLKQQRVNLGLIAEEIGADLRAQNPRRNAQFVIAPDLLVEADPNLIRIALQNLIDNAWKFTGPREKARIEVGATNDGNERVYFVSDNGVGFDMTNADKLFGAFQRLHGLSEFPGTGIGLATVRRVINRHNGRIWVEAAAGRGATFFFTLGSRID